MEKVWYPGNLVTGTAREPSGTERETSGTAGGTWEGKAAQQPPSAAVVVPGLNTGLHKPIFLLNTRMYIL